MVSLLHRAAIIKRHFTMPHQITCASALSGKTGKRENAFSLKCCISALPEFNQLLDFFNVFDSRLILTLLYDSLSLVVNAFSYRVCWEHGSGERKSIALHQFDCVARTIGAYTSPLSSGFPISQGNAEALDRWGGKTNHHMISYLLGNTSAKNYCNRIVYVKIMASRRWEVFETRCISDIQ